MNVMEFALCLVVGSAALGPLLLGRGRNWSLAAGVVLAGVATAWCYAPGKPRVPGNADGLPQQVAGTRIANYVSSDACRSCHPGEYASWHHTYHRTMTQLATPETVVAPFDGVNLESRGRRYELQRRGDEFWIRMADPDWEHPLQRDGVDLRRIADPPLVDRRIFMTTGSHHMQGYWVKSRYGNMMRQVPWYYLIPEQKWVPREDAFLQPPDDKRHFMTWNDGCLQCHSVGGKPLMDLKTGSGIPDTEVAEFGISCEACHGPAAQHVAKHRDPLNRYRAHHDGLPDDSIVNPARLSSQRSSEVCGSCHGFSRFVKPREFVVDGLKFRPGDDLERTLKLVQYSPELDGKAKDIFWPDGTCRTGGDEFNGLAASKCYQQGELSCLSCHSMHRSDPNDQLAARRDGNEACLQCHTDYRDRLEAHTHHPAASSGSLCYNCHMPHTSYALLTAMRSHRVDSPSVETSVKTGRPNACNLCHLDRTLDWTARRLTEWYGTPTVALDEDQQTVAASLLWLYRGDAVQRAVAGWSLGWKDAQAASGDDWLAPHVAELLDDPYAAVRFIGHRSWTSLPDREEFSYDYVGPPGERAAAKQRVVSRWEQGAGTKQPTELRPRLLSEPNRILRDEIERLLSTRDHSEVKVAE